MGIIASLFNFDISKSSNDKNTEKIWQGSRIEPFYNSNISVGQAILSALTRCEYQVLQTSHNSGIKYTGLDLKLKTIRIARFLQKNNFKQGDVIGLACKNSDNFAPIVFGALLIGTPISPLDTGLKKDDIVYVYRITQPKLVFCDSENYPEVRLALGELNSEVEIYTVNRKVLGVAHINEIPEYSNEMYSEFIPPKLLKPQEHPAAILCSSGTTGPIKAVAVSHAALLNQDANAYTIKSDDVFFNPNSIYWISSLWTLVIGTLKGCVRIITEHFTPDMLADIIETHKATVILVPVGYLQTLENCGRNLDSVRIYQGAGAPVPSAQRIKINGFSKNAFLYVPYGLTEIGGVINDYLENTPEKSVGRPDVNFQMKIIGRNGKCLDAEQLGEIYIKAAYKFLGYYGNPEKTCRAIDSEGWFHSGDMGYFDKDGWLYLVARKGENFRTQGYRIVPQEIEEIILELPAVSSACISGIADPILNDHFPAAAVIIKPGHVITETEVAEYLDTRVPDYKRVRGGVYFLDEFPRTSTGKIRRRLVLDIVQKLYDKAKAENKGVRL